MVMDITDDKKMGKYTLKWEEVAKPLHLQKIEQAMDVRPLISYVKDVFKAPVTETDSSDSESEATSSQAIKANGEKLYDGVTTSKLERRSDKLRLYNFSQVARERLWLRDVLVTDSEDSEDSEIWSTEERIRHLLYYHQLRRKYQTRFYSNPENVQYQYYGAGLLSNFDKFPEHQKSVTGNRKRKRERFSAKRGRGRRSMKDRPIEQEGDAEHLNDEERYLLNAIQAEEEGESGSLTMGTGRGIRGRRKKQQQTKSPEVMAMRRRKIWMMMSKKELGKVQRAKTNNHKEMLTTCRRVAQYCMRHWRHKAMQSQKNMKDTIWRAKRLTREMQAYWKRYDRVERETRRRMEKEAEEQRKMDVELMEAKRQQRKLNFLITQTELYAHFMSKKLGGASQQEQLRILSQLDEDKNPRLAAVDDYDSDSVKLKVKMNVSQAFRAEQQRTMQFSQPPLLADEIPVIETPTEDRPQPAMFRGSLKHYQLKGLNWIANLYDQGINGILADEMGLGKTVQSIAVLCHIAEKYGIWGPFLIISPASTLHNWQQEMARFVPGFKLVPYWGSPQERKILRGFWEQKDMHTKEASFHVVITSYQLVIQDFKYFNRIKWQYMILDEAQAIKSTSSVRWKLLQAFSCRNRLLLSGTPIQNSMAELWALLHFIMPTLFDSHDEFNEWFSKDIESHAENKTYMDEKNLSRLHMILKPFMLRRIKKDVENELSDKIEVMVYCPLTTRQKLLYSAVKKKIRIEDLLQTGSTQSAQSVTSCLMNLVMQFRKVCNHPELFERREARWPLFMTSEAFEIPKLVAEDGIFSISIPSKRHLTMNKFSIFASEYIHRSLHPIHPENHQEGSIFSFLRILGVSPSELEKMMLLGLVYLWSYSWWIQRKGDNWCHQLQWQKNLESQSKEKSSSGNKSLKLASLSQLFNVYTHSLAPYLLRTSSVLRHLVFTGMTGWDSTVHTHTKHVFHCMPETMEHRLLRSRKAWAALRKDSADAPSTSGKDAPDSGNAAESSKPNPGRTLSSGKQQRNVGGTVDAVTDEAAARGKVPVLPEFKHVFRPPRTEECAPTDLPAFLSYTSPKVQFRSRDLFASSRAAAWRQIQHKQCGGPEGAVMVWYGSPELAELAKANQSWFTPVPRGGLTACMPPFGWSNVLVPDKQSLVTDSGKLFVLDHLLKKLKQQGHRVLIYSQMTKMIDLLEEYMWHRKLTYMRLDGSSKISERRDMVADFQARTDIFVFLLSTRAGGLGINLTAADTVIFYDSDWNPTVDQQAMDRAHRLGQTKQVTVYRLICNGTIEERILQRAREKSEIQRMVISGETFKPDTLKPKEVVSLLLDDEEIELKYRQKQEERRMMEEGRALYIADRKRRLPIGAPRDAVRIKTEGGGEEWVTVDTKPSSPATSEPSNVSSAAGLSSGLIGAPATGIRRRHAIRGSRRGRPRGVRRGGGTVRGQTDIPMSSGSLVADQLSTSASTPAVSISNTEPTASPPVVPTSVPTPSGMVAGRGIITARRGPGRPRLKPSGPANVGTRGIRRPRKPVRPLPVPLGRGHSSSTTSLGLPPEMLLSTPAASSSSPAPPPKTGPGFYCQVDYAPE